MDSPKRKITLPIRWEQLVISAFFFRCFLAFISPPPMLFSSVWDYIFTFFALILLLAILRLCVHYTISDQFLIAKFLYIPFRRIRWKDIDYAIYVHKRKDIYLKYSVLFRGILPRIGTRYEQIIYVSLAGCSHYIPSYHIRLFHNLRHPFRTMCLWLPSGSKYPTYQIVDTFQECYPELKIQPTKQEDLGRFAGLTALHENAENGPITRN